jgi:hypothetical protein
MTVFLQWLPFCVVAALVWCAVSLAVHSLYLYRLAKKVGISYNNAHNSGHNIGPIFTLTQVGSVYSLQRTASAAPAQSWAEKAYLYHFGLDDQTYPFRAGTTLLAVLIQWGASLLRGLAHPLAYRDQRVRRAAALRHACAKFELEAKRQSTVLVHFIQLQSSLTDVVAKSAEGYRVDLPALVVDLIAHDAGVTPAYVVSLLGTTVDQIITGQLDDLLTECASLGISTD